MKTSKNVQDIKMYMIKCDSCIHCFSRFVGNIEITSWRYPSDKKRISSFGGQDHSSGSENGVSRDNHAW